MSKKSPVTQDMQSLQDHLLLEQTKSLAAAERKITLKILHHLREVARRRLHLQLGYSSLFTYVVKELGYSEASAGRRLAAMKLMEDLPEVEAQIQSGALTLTNAAQAARLFEAERKLDQPLSATAKQEILENLSHLSTREAERKLMEHSSQPIPAQRPDVTRPIPIGAGKSQGQSASSTYSQVSFVADQALLDQLELIKGLLAHRAPNLTYAELFAEMAKITLQKLQPKPPESQPEAPKEAPTQAPEVRASQHPADLDPRSPHCGAAASRSRYIPASIKRAVYARDQGKCQYRDPESGRICSSHYQLTYDHIQDFARGGPTTVENIELKCKNHNLLKALQTYGPSHMSRWVSVG